jgi:hypothetical protein
LQGGKDERFNRPLNACEHAGRVPSGFRNGSVDDVVIDPQSGTLGSVSIISQRLPGVERVGRQLQNYRM